MTNRRWALTLCAWFCCSICEQLFCTSLLGWVGAGAESRLYCILSKHILAVSHSLSLFHSKLQESSRC